MAIFNDSHICEHRLLHDDAKIDLDPISVAVGATMFVNHISYIYFLLSVSVARRVSRFDETGICHVSTH